MQTRLPWWRSVPVIGAVSAIVLLLLAELVLGNLGGPAADWTLFFGRLHPLMVHLPIGIFVLVVVAEIGTLVPRLRQRIEPALGLILPLLLLSAVAAFVLGHFLARDGGFPLKPLMWHRRLAFIGATGAALCLIAWTYRSETDTPVARGVYRALLVASFGVLGLGAHFGGTLTRGDAYLGKYAPGPLKGWLGATAEPAPSAKPKPKADASAEALLYADVVQPLLNDYCVECHGPEKTKGDLRLDTLELLQKGGESGDAITPGNARESLMIERLHLPVDDEDHMPPEDEKQPSPEEIAILEFWIDRGASTKLVVRDLLAPPNTRALLERVSKGGPSVPAPPGSTAPPAPPSSAPPGAAALPAKAPSSSANAAPAERALAPKAPAPAEPASVERAATPSVEAPATPSVSSSGGAFAILSAKCEGCHGAKKQKGKLRVDSLAALLRGGKGGAAIVPGKPDQSPLIERVRLPLEDDDHMPPKKEPQLSAAEIATLRAFIAKQSGAPRPELAAEPARAANATPGMPGKAAIAGNPGEPTAAGPAPAEPPADPGVSEEAPARAPEKAEAEAVDPELLARLPEKVALFGEVVQPLLVDRCGECHDGEYASAGLRVKAHADLMRGGKEGPAVVPRDPEKSPLLQRMLLPLSDGDHMPPEEKPQPAAGEIELVRSWIALGADADAAIDPRTLPPPALRALAARYEPAATSSTPPAVRADAGGCAACSVGAGRAGPDSVLAVTAALGLALGLWRRSRRRSVAVDSRG